MANRNWNRRQALEKEVKDLYALVTIGASGAPTLTTGYGIASIAKSATGDYQITLQDAYMSLKHVSAVHLSATAEDLTFQVKAADVSSAKTIDLYTLTGGTPTNPASGTKLVINIQVKNTSVI